MRFLVGLVVAGVVIAQDLSVSSNWSSSSTSADSRSVREGYANDAAAALVKNIAPNGSLTNTTDSQTLSSMYTVLAMQDALSGNTTWKAAVSNSKTWIGQTDIYGNGTAGSKRTNSNGMQWALAFYYAYKAYGDSAFLTLAQNTFDTTYGDYITPSVAAAKHGGPGRNISFNASSCFDSTAGGIFWLPDVPDNPQIQADAVGPFAILAGLLYEETKNETYKTLGLQSVQFMGGLLWDAPNNMELGVYDVSACIYNTGQSPGLQGWYIYALSIFANITSDSGLTGRLRTAVSTAAHTTAWTEPDGILLDTQTNISSDEFDDKGILVRALSETIRRFPTAGDLVQFIEAFLTVQYNGATKNARSGSSYSSVLFGPPPAEFSNAGNLVALDVLNAAFDMVPKNSTTSSTGSSSSPSTTAAGSHSSSTSSSTPVGAIVGGVVGGVAAIAALIGAFFWWRRSRRQGGYVMREPFDGDKPNNSSYENSPNAPAVAYAVEPFVASSPGPMSSPQFNESHTTGLSGIQSASTAPSSNSNQLRAVNAVPQAPTGYSSKLARMNAPPPPLPRGTSSPSAAPLTPPASDSSQGAEAGSNAQQQDIPTLVGRLVNDLLREHGTVPPQYEER
ncbi:hypothetical protein PENSPDRAFT_686824 [Peniophora sp. CONT]|nr:hypothetical protein PENSPDRAFT_686824 [Peniophora sp. CONT]